MIVTSNKMRKQDADMDILFTETMIKQALREDMIREREANEAEFP